MAQQSINFGSYTGEVGVDSTYLAFQKTQANFTDLYSQISTGGGSVTLPNQPGSSVLSIGTVLGREFHVDNFPNANGTTAQGDAQQISGQFSIAAGSTLLTCSTAPFTAAMTNKTILLPAAGPNVTWPANGTWPGGTFPSYLIATMTYVSATQVTLSVAASFTLTAAQFTVNVGTDDTLSFLAAFAAAGETSPQTGAQVWISPQKRYIVTQQLVMPSNCGLYCEGHLRDKNATGWYTQGGFIILPPGAPCSTANSGNPGTGFAWNPQRTTMAIVPGASGWIEGVSVISAGMWPAQTALDMEAMVFGTQYGMVVSGNGIQCDKASAYIKDCNILGFGQGVVNTVQKTSGGTLSGYAARHPKVEACNLDNGCSVLYGPSSTNTDIRDSTFTYWLLVANVGASPSQWTFPTPVSDGAGGCIISLTSTATTLGGQAGTPVWTNGFNQYIGQCSTGQTLTVSLFDHSGDPITNTAGMTANRAVGTLTVSTTNSQGFDLHIPNAAPSQFANYVGGQSGSGTTTVGYVGNYGNVGATPTQAAFTACSIRPGPDIYLDGAQFVTIPDCIFTGGNGILAANTSTIHILNAKCDGSNQDAATMTNGFALSITGATGNGFWLGGSVNNFFGGVQNLATNSVWTWLVNDVLFDGPIVHIYHDGQAMVFNGVWLGSNGSVVIGPNAALATFTGPYWNNNPDYYPSYASVQPISVGGYGAPAAMVNNLLNAYAVGLPTAPTTGTATVWNNGGVLSYS